MNAWADGLNYYLAKHPSVKPRVITRFEPWMALTFSEGSIGGDIERVNLKRARGVLRQRRRRASTRAEPPLAPTPPSRPARTASPIAPVEHQRRKHALLLINPHTSFFFRSEAQMVSDEGLNAYGALDVGTVLRLPGVQRSRRLDAHVERRRQHRRIPRDGRRRRATASLYSYGAEERPLTATKITVPYKTGAGMAQKEFTVYRTHHGPVVREADGKWVSVRLMQEPLKALTQSYTRTKAKNYQAFRDTMELPHQLVEQHDLRRRRRRPSRTSTRTSSRSAIRSSTGPSRWTAAIRRPNGTACSRSTKRPACSTRRAAGSTTPTTGRGRRPGPSSPKKTDFPAYVERGEREPARRPCDPRAARRRRTFTLDSLIAAAYDSYLPEFDDPDPAAR